MSARVPRSRAHDRRKVDLHLAAVHADLAGVAGFVRDASRVQQGLGRYAARHEAVAPEQVALDQRGPSPEDGHPCGAHQAGGAASNRDQVVGLVLGERAPRIDTGQQPSVGLVVGQLAHAKIIRA